MFRSMYAIIETGGKQYRLSVGTVVNIEKLPQTLGEKVSFDKVLLVGSEEQTLVGTPYVAKASLEGEVVSQAKGDKILTIKYRRRKGFRKSIGHRQLLTRLLVTKIEDGAGKADTFDNSKRAEVLHKASIALAETAPKTKKEAAPKTEKKAKKAKSA